jgi:hypothetical protein
MKSIVSLLSTSAIVATVSATEILSTGAAVPTAIFHGFGDSCWFPGMLRFTSEIANLTGAYATCIEIGWGSPTSIFENFETQAEEACKKVQADPNF